MSTVPPTAFAILSGDKAVGPGTLVLLNRELKPGVAKEALSSYGDDRWVLDHGVFEEDAKARSLNFLRTPDKFRNFAKRYFWTLINCDPPVQLRRTTVSRPSLGAMMGFWAPFHVFLDWLQDQGISEIPSVTEDVLEHYMGDIAEASVSIERKYRRVVEVRRLWGYRTLLPESMRLPEMPPWGGDSPHELLGKTRPQRENLTPRISENVMQNLLEWALRFVEDFAPDIHRAHAEYLRLQNAGRRHLDSSRRPSGGAIRDVTDYVERLKRDGRNLPGKVVDGQVVVNFAHIGRALGIRALANPSYRACQAAVLSSGLGIDVGSYLETAVTATIEGRPWHPERFSYYDAWHLARHLSTACLIVVAYLSGARPGEVLNLRRGCIQFDETAELWLMSGVYFKNAVDDQGNKIPAGLQRRDPWVVVEQVARAVQVLEKLHSEELLFPTRIDDARKRAERRSGARARVGQVVTEDIARFIDFVKSLGDHHEMGLTNDPQGVINITRFRRTLAWFIRRRPRGLVAGALQYGHVHTRMMQGYAGDYDSGFPDELAFEDFLARLEGFAEDERRLADGERVSGPAAKVYERRVIEANRFFAGHVLKSNRQARDMIGNPLLQIYHGEGMTCVFDATKAACQLRGTADDPLVTPDLDDCRVSCRNIARTDRDIVVLRQKRDSLRHIVQDPLAPPIRSNREVRELERLEEILEGHGKR